LLLSSSAAKPVAQDSIGSRNPPLDNKTRLGRPAAGAHPATASHSGWGSTSMEFSRRGGFRLACTRRPGGNVAGGGGGGGQGGQGERRQTCGHQGVMGGGQGERRQTCGHQGCISLCVCVAHAYVSICVAACICLGLCLAIYMYVRVPVYICVHMPSRQTVGSSLPTTCRLAVT